MSFIPHSRPFLEAEEREAVDRVLRSGQIAQGPEVALFEEELAAFLGLPYAVALSHGTAALHLGLVALGAKPGTEVLLPSYSCPALLNAVVYTGAEPVLVDCAPGEANADAKAMARRAGPRTAAAIVTHMFGRPAPFPPGVPVLEDATHALGARQVGSRGRACALSFYATKMLAGGEAGALASRRAAVRRAAVRLRSYDKWPRWRPGYNYKMTDLAAALLRVQLRRLPAFLERRALIAAYYTRELEGCPVVLPRVGPGEAVYRYVVQVRRGKAATAIRELRARGVGADRPVLRPLHRHLGLPVRDFPHAEKLWRSAVSLPLYPALTDTEVERVARAAREVLQGLA